MGVETGIGWTDSTFNLWRGCIEDEGSEACDNCYAKAIAKRNPKLLGTWGSEADGGIRVVAPENYWAEPIKWNKAAAAAGVRHKVFCASLADVFEDWDGPMVDIHGHRLWVSTRGIAAWEADIGEPGFAFDRRPLTMQDVRIRLFKLIDATPCLDWQLLTKRPQNILRFWPDRDNGLLAQWVHEKDTYRDGKLIPYRDNVWLGATVENQLQARRRIPELLKCRDLSPVLWLSCEPLLGPVDLREAHMTQVNPSNWPGPTRVDWVVVGCESGPHARPTDREWFESLRDQCADKGVAYFMKQIVVDGKLHKQLHEFPADLMIQEFPRVSHVAS